MLNIKIKNIEILRKIIINIVTDGFLLRFIFQYFFIITLIILFFPYNFQHYNFTALIMIKNNILSSFFLYTHYLYVTHSNPHFILYHVLYSIYI